MNELYKIEECPRGKQDLKRIISQIKMRAEFEALSRMCRCEHAGTVKCGTCDRNRGAIQ